MSRTMRDAHRRLIRRTRGQRGQSLVEFAVVLPVLLALVGVVIDAARLYQAWTNLESATRDAAQYLATSDKDPYSPDYTWAGSDADTKAKYILELATAQTFTASTTSGTLTGCDAPQVTTTYSTDTSWQNGGSASFPLSTARVVTCMPFKTIFAYPFITNEGSIELRSEREMTILVGR